MGWMTGVRFLAGSKRPNWVWDSPNLLFDDDRRLFSWGKATGAWNWPVTSTYYPTDVNEWSFTSTPPYVFLA